MEQSNSPGLRDISPTRTLLSSNLKGLQESSISLQKDAIDENQVSQNQKSVEETQVLNGQVVKFKKMFQNPNIQIKKDEDIYNGAILNLEHCFGFQNTPIYKNSHFISEDTIVFPSGRHLATIDLVSRKMDFIRREDQYASQITSLCVGLSRKKELVIAIAEKTLTGVPKVQIYIPSRLRWFKLDHDQEVLPMLSETASIEQILIPNFKKYCITVTQSVDQGSLVVAYFRYEKEKLSRVSEIKSVIRRITVNPKNYYQFLACGKSYLKMYDASDKNFKELKDLMIPMKYERDNDFIDAVYIQESIFVTISTQNNLFIVENGLVKYYINISFSTKNSIRNLNQNNQNINSAAKSTESQLGNEQTAEDDGANAQMSCLAAHKKGFVVGSKKGGYLGIYEIERDFSINHVDTFKIEQNCTEVTSLSISFDRSHLIINAKIQEEQSLTYQANDQIEHDAKERLEMYQLNLHQLSVLKNVFTLPIKNVFPKGNTSGPILDLAVGISKDIIVSVGADYYIRVFEYAGSSHSYEGSGSAGGAGSVPSSSTVSFNQISTHKSKDFVYCIAVHPMGQQIAAGYKEKLKIYYLLEDEVRIAIDMPTKICQCAKYSYGGQYLAAANGSVIQIIDSYTFEVKFQLFGHPSFVRILSWNESDSMLLSVCNNGSAYGWSTNFEIYNKDKSNKKKIQDDQAASATKLEFIMKGVRIHSVGYDEEFDLLFASSSDNRLTIFSTDNGKGTKNYLSLFTGHDTELTSLLLAKQQSVLFAGTNKGSIRVYLWPILKKKVHVNLLHQSGDAHLQQQQSEFTCEYMEYFVHLGKVITLSLSADRQSLISSSEDGSIFIQQIKEMCNGIDINLNISLLPTSSSSNQHQEIIQKKKKSQMMNKCKVYLNMNQLSLVFKQAIEAKNSQIQELKYKVENLKSYFQEELQNIANEKTQEITKLKEKNTRELEEEKQRYKSLQEEHENERNYLLKTIENNLDSHKKELKEINDDYQLKLKNAYKQHDKLVEAYEESKMNYKGELEAILDKNKEALEQIEKEYRIKYEELQKNHIRLINDMKRDGEKFDVALEQCEQEYEKELLKRREDFSSNMNKINKQYEDMRESHEKLFRDKDTLGKKLVDCEEIQFKLGSEQEQFHKKILDSNTRLVKMQEQLGEREEVIKSKEKNIKDLRNINTHLENFRFVLDHKIRSLKDEKLPMEAQIKNLEKHIKQMYSELLEECDKKKELMNKLKDSENKLTVLKQQLKKRSDEVVFTKRKLENLQYDLGNLIRNESLNDWPEKVAKLYAKHFDEKTGRGKEEIRSPERQDDGLSQGLDAEGEEEFSIKEELIRQNNWMNSKLKSIVDKNGKLEKEKKDLYQKIQKENTELIKECNMLRTSNQKISKKVLVLEKKLKDISGISLSNANLVENQLEGFLKKAAPLTSKNRETPFVQMKKGGQSGNKRNQMLIDYYNQYASTQLVKNDTMNGGENLDGILGEMEKNQNQISMQNFEIQQLQDRVQQFLRQPSGKDEESKQQQTLPPIQGLMKSESQPVLLGADYSHHHQTAATALSMTLRKESQSKNLDSQQKSLYKYPGQQSTTMSHSSLMIGGNNLTNQSTNKKDERQKHL